MFSEASNIDDLASRAEWQLRDWGLDGFSYWTHVRKAVDKLRADEVFFCARGPYQLKAFEALYWIQKFYRDDPAMLKSAEAHTPFSTREVRLREPTSRRLRWLYALERKFGLYHDLYIPIHTPLRIQVLHVFGLGEDPQIACNIRERTPELQLLALAFGNAAVDFFVLGEENSYAELFFTRREQECLAHMARGLTNGEIARLLGVSERTVKFHVAQISAKLGAANRTEAIARAARSGWITN